MKDAVLRLFFISLTVLMTGGLVIFGLNWMGQKQEFSPLDHPLLNNQPDYFIATQTRPTTPDSTSFKQNIPFVHINSHKEAWVLKSPNNNKKVALSKYLEEKNTKKIAVFVHSRINLGALVKDFFDHGLQEQVIVFANEQKILIELKKMAPRWLYAANPSQKMRLKVMTSFWLSSLSSFDFDFFIIDPINDKELGKSLIRELKKRHKKILIKTHQPAQHPLNSFDGYLLM